MKLRCNEGLRPAAVLVLMLIAAGAGAGVPAAPADLAPAPASAPSAPARNALPQLLKLDRLTDEQLQRLRKVANDQGTSIALPPAVVAILRLSPGAVAPLVRQVSFQREDGVKHGFARLNDDSGFFLFRKSGPQDLSVFRLDAAQKLVGAAHTFQGERLITLPPGAAQAAVDAELAAWSSVLSPRGVSLPRPGAGTMEPAAPGKP